MILHIVNKSPYQHQALQQCLAMLSESDSVLLIEDAVLLFSNPNHHYDLPGTDRLYTLQTDCEARGVLPAPNTATLTDFNGFVDLVVSHDKSISWF